MTDPKILLNKARQLAIHSQLLDNKTRFPRGKEGIARAIEHLGYVQIDTIAVIERAHHHTIWVRRPDYKQQMLDELLAKDRRIFEYWGHAMSCLPITDYRYYLPRMKRFADPYSKWEKERLKKYGHMMTPVLERITNEGALSSKDFEPPKDTKGGGWWNWRPAKVALEMLFWQGKLMITRRHNFQRVYDLTERVLPDNIDTSCPSDDELGRFFIGRALNSYGLATEKEICDHIDAADKKVIAKMLKEMSDAGEVLKLAVNGVVNSAYYALPERFEKVSNLRKPKPNVYLLSPFDNLIILRDRLKRLFSFDYALECYTPAAKRVNGYFVLPILFGDRFAGRLDPKADRKAKTLIIHRLLLEDDFEPDDRFLDGFTESLVDFMSFNNCENIKLAKVTPSKYKSKLDKLIRKNI